MKNTLLLILYLLTSLCIQAQDMGVSNVQQGLPSFMIKTNLMSLANPFRQSAILTGDFSVNERITMDIGLGYYYTASQEFVDQTGESYRGQRLRLGGKYHFNIKNNIALYAGFEGKHDRVTNKQWGTLLRQGGQYVESALVDRNLQSYGAAARFGVSFFLGPEKNLLIDLYAGLGMVHHIVQFDTPEDAEFNFNRNGFFSFLMPAGESTIPDLILGVHIGYAFWE